MSDLKSSGKPTYEELERRIRKLEKEILGYISKASELNEKRKVTEYSHIRRTTSLMHINEELERENKELKRADSKDCEPASRRLGEKIKEFTCLYDISSPRDADDYSLNTVLQAVIDFIPPAIQYPDITCARLVFGNQEVATKNFKNTRQKLTRNIAVRDKRIGTLEVCYLGKRPNLGDGPFLREAKNVVNAVAESIARIFEHEKAEAEIRKHQNHIEVLIKNESPNNGGN